MVQYLTAITQILVFAIFDINRQYSINNFSKYQYKSNQNRY